ncbi:MAG: hypothetical protein RL536_23 [Candidatus Parcubacteria bacterium]
MEKEIQNNSPKISSNLIQIAIILSATLIAITFIFKYAPVSRSQPAIQAPTVQASLVDAGHILPLAIEQKMLADLTKGGVIDGSRLSQVTELNLLWAYGLANANPVLSRGPIMDMRYGGPENMASVGGWTVSTGNVMDHYGKHKLSILTPEQQQLVEKIAKGIYRPCCDNSTYFPDCNHGMAMLGLLEYLASQGATEDQMWNVAMTVNVSWFPDQYQAIGLYLKQNGRDIKSMSPQELLGYEYSSGSGFAKIASQVYLPKSQSGSGCGVGTVESAPRPKSGCGI